MQKNTTTLFFCILKRKLLLLEKKQKFRGEKVSVYCEVICIITTLLQYICSLGYFLESKMES